MKKRYGIVSYNLYGNFTNYGSALQSFALQTAVDRLAPEKLEALILDYCPDVLLDKDPLSPMKAMWDTDSESRKMCEMSLPAIRENYQKFQNFFHEKLRLSQGKYKSDNFDQSFAEEELAGYICGSDTLWDIGEFHGFDDGYFANYPIMKQNYTVTYAVSCGDAEYKGQDEETFKDRLRNFDAISLREEKYLNFVKQNTYGIEVQSVIDPTLLLTSHDYDQIAAKRIIEDPYILYYSRRYNPEMETYVDQLAKQKNCRVVEISLRAVNRSRHMRYYYAGVEEFLSLVKYSEFVVTNSFHGAIFSILYQKPFYLFSRERCDTKISELLSWMNISDRMIVSRDDAEDKEIPYLKVHQRIADRREVSIQYLKKVLLHDL